MDCNYVSETLQNGLSRFIGKKNAVIGISGGIDSAVVASLCVNAIGKGRVVGVQMPYSSQSTKDGTCLINHLGLEDGPPIDIEPIVDSFVDGLYMLDQNNLTNGNIRARIRMTILYAIAGQCNGLVIGTGNKTEIELGYFTKYGDGGCDLEPIGDLYKTEVFELARHLGVPDCIINKTPSAELWDGQTDEGEIGMSYAEMDGILKDGRILTSIEIIEKYGQEKVKKIQERVENSYHKRNMPKTLLLK